MKAALPTSLFALALLGACTTPIATTPLERMSDPALQPEAASASQSKPGWAYPRMAVAAANPLATQAGWHILQAGGNAIDAAVAVQMVLALVEPQSSGIGGGAFLMHFDGTKVRAYDGRETAPALATGQLFMGPNGQPMDFAKAVVGGRSVGTPGAVRMLEMAHRQQGRLPWATLFEPAIALAEAGFAVSPRLHSLLQADTALRQDPVAAAYFYNAQGTAWPVGHVLKNPELAHVLRRIATEGSPALHEGTVAHAVVDKVRQHPNNPGSLSLQDLAAYTPIEREPLCFDHTPNAVRTAAITAEPTAVQRSYRLCGFPPPSSGALAIGQILGMLEHTGAQGPELDNGVPSADWLHRYTEAARLAFADRAQYVADPDFVQAPGGDWLSLLQPAYLQRRARLIGAQSMTSALPGLPAGANSGFAPMPWQLEYGTSHISVVDGQGHAVAMTTTIEAAFGSRQMVTTDASRPGGFLLNNQLTDFSFLPADAQGRPIANRVEPGKRPRSSMSPTLVFDKPSGQLLMTGGSPGGAVIIHYTGKWLVGSLHWGLNAQQAINLPNFGALGGPTLLEQGRFPVSTIKALRARGHTVRELDLTSGLQAIERTPTGWFGGADPRREGIVLGQ